MQRFSPLAFSGLILAGTLLAGCATTPPRTTNAPAPVIEQERPEPPTPGIKPLTVEQEEQAG